MGLFPKRKEKLLIKTFGEKNEDLGECGIVEFCVGGLSQSSGVQMTAHAVPLICSPLVNQVVQFAQQSYSHLVDLKLGDQSSEDCVSQVDVLIGNDFYWSFFTGDTKQGESGPVTMKTSLGWVLSGPLPQTTGLDTDVHSVTSNALRLDTSSCGDTVTEKKIYDPQLEQVKNSGS